MSRMNIVNLPELRAKFLAAFAKGDYKLEIAPQELPKLTTKEQEIVEKIVAWLDGYKQDRDIAIHFLLNEQEKYRKLFLDIATKCRESIKQAVLKCIQEVMSLSDRQQLVDIFIPKKNQLIDIPEYKGIAFFKKNPIGGGLFAVLAAINKEGKLKDVAKLIMKNHPEFWKAEENSQQYSSQDNLFIQQPKPKQLKISL